ncbi:MAG: hypothetical protein DWG79_01605 [Chloroflexi bacterium]|nr:hypothetical protein [Chloroflexota bacterium]MDA1148144.1 hypothetical protein [Chloroflexota bacterium]MQC82546.1 hypothetical protein [Chloroflexota bacterium]MQC83201.1 hypothetical protein [Chloroflexota bacterium]PKB56447.1 MAG: hypothetical protein BZY69_01665 [SAR202 cluster bacterium Casp-Chloro-G1]
MTLPTPYDESIPAPRWLLGVAAVAGVVMVIASVVVLLAGEMPALGRIPLAAVLLLAGLAMFYVVRTFATLRVHVTAERLQFGFGPLGRELVAGAILDAAPDRYPWLRYGGWGVRISSGGHRAYSQAFQRGSVVIRAADDHRYHVSSRQPAALAEAINRMATGESASS